MLHCDSAVDAQYLSGNVFCADKISDRVRDMRRLAHPSERYHRKQRIIRLLSGHVCFYKAGSDCVAAYSARRKLLCNRFCQTDKSCL